MDPRDDLDSLAGGVDCAACGEVVPTDRVRVLAKRDDIAFVEIHCAACRSESLGIVIHAAEIDAATRYGEFGPGEERRFEGARPIGPADVARVHALLAQGGLDALVGRPEPPPGGSAP
ncbi:MAG: hypothetical protein H0U52_17110 [Chloroflexi bacterium]|nr:hypothetical protein [Chloroflexota bacterium]